jgi:hypothetical protein
MQTSATLCKEFLRNNDHELKELKLKQTNYKPTEENNLWKHKIKYLEKELNRFKEEVHHLKKQKDSCQADYNHCLKDLRHTQNIAAECL